MTRARATPLRPFADNIDARMRKGNDLDRVLRAGSVFRFRGEDMDAADDIEFRLRVAGGSDLECVNLSLP